MDDSTTATKSYNRPLALSAMICIGCAGVFFTGVKPLILSTYREKLGFGVDVAGYLVALETAGNCFGVLLVATCIKRWNRRRIGIVALIDILLGNFISFPLHSILTLAPVRFIVGCGEGLAIGVMSSMLAGSAKPDRNFATYTATALLVQTLGFLVVPSLVRMFGVDGVFVLLVMAMLPAGLTCWFLPRVAPELTTCSAVSRGDQDDRRRDAVMVVLGSAIAYLGIGGFSPFMGEVAGLSGLQGQFRANALALAQFCGFLGAMAATGQNLRFGRVRPTVGGLSIMVLSVAAVLIVPHSEALFTVAMCLFLFSWLYFFAYLAGLAAAVDRQGAAATLMFTTTSFGFAVGPAMEGWIAKHTGGYSVVELVTIGLLTLSIGLIGPVARRRDVTLGFGRATMNSRR